MRNGCGREGFASLIQSLILYISLPKEGRECMRARTHNLPIMYVSCVAHVDSRRRLCVEFTLRVPDEYRVTVAAEDCRWKNFGREFRYTRARTRVIAREIGRRWASFNPKMGRWEWISRSSLRKFITGNCHLLSPLYMYMYILCLSRDSL